MKTKLCGVVLAFVFSVTACKPIVRQEPLFEPSIATKDDGKLVARQVVLLTNESESEIEKRIKNDPQLEEKLHQVLVTRGKEHKIVDTLRSFFSWPEKLLLWNRTVGSGELHEDAEIAVKLALADGGSTSTHISINEYDPKIIWQRTFQNDKTSILSKVTFGTLIALIYTVIPGRLFYGVGDHYNPFADTVVLYSDNLDIALHEAGHAIDFSEKQKNHIGPGLYSLARFFFPITLYQEAVATGKAFEFTAEHGASEDVRSSYALLFPAFGTYLAGSIFAANGMIDVGKKLAGKEQTRLTKWLNRRAEGMADWWKSKAFKMTGEGTAHVNYEDLAKFKESAPAVKKLGVRAMKFAIIIPVIVAAHIVGRVMGAFVKTPHETPINPKFDQ